MRYTRFIPGAFALAFLPALASGCVGHARGGVYAEDTGGYAGDPSYGDSYADGSYYADMAPPPPRESVVYSRPGHVWVTGRWGRVGSRWLWHRGYWVRQRPGMMWAQPRWVRSGNRWMYRPGGWNRGRAMGRGDVYRRDRALDRGDRAMDRRDNRLDRRDNRLDRRDETLDERRDRIQRERRDPIRAREPRLDNQPPRRARDVQQERRERVRQEQREKRRRDRAEDRDDN